MLPSGVSAGIRLLSTAYVSLELAASLSGSKQPIFLSEKSDIKYQTLFEAVLVILLSKQRKLKTLTWQLEFRLAESLVLPAGNRLNLFPTNDGSNFGRERTLNIERPSAEATDQARRSDVPCIFEFCFVLQSGYTLQKIWNMGECWAILVAGQNGTAFACWIGIVGGVVNRDCANYLDFHDSLVRFDYIEMHNY